MDLISAWLFLSLVVERVVELTLCMMPYLDDLRLLGINMPVALALVLSPLLSFGAQLSFFEIFEISFRWPWLGYLLTAFFMVGGSGAIHDVLGWIKGQKENSRVLDIK